MGPPRTRSSHELPPSSVRTSAPASIATNTLPATAGSVSIHRTWWVSGRGGKLHDREDGSARSPDSSPHVSPPLSERKTALGSVPAYTIPRSAGLTATAVISACEMPAPTGSQRSPASSLRHNPLPHVPQYTRPLWCGSTARHSGDLSRRCSSTVHCEARRAISSARSVAIAREIMRGSHPYHELRLRSRCCDHWAARLRIDTTFQRRYAVRATNISRFTAEIALGTSLRSMWKIVALAITTVNPRAARGVNHG